MKAEMDFLPVTHKVGRDRRRARRWSFLLIAIVCCAFLMTEGVLRYRLRGLRAVRTQARQQAEVASLQTAQITELQGRHQRAIEELAEWVAPLERRRATEVLDGILISRPATIHLQLVDWQAGAPAARVPPRLRIGGLLEDLGDLVAFLTAMERTGDLPRLEVRRSGISGVPTASSLQSFEVESVARGEGGR